MMSFNIPDSGWNRIAPTLDVEVLHGIPVRVSSMATNRSKPSSTLAEGLDTNMVSDKIRALTGLEATICDWVSLSADEQEWAVCVDSKQFSEVLHRLALASAGLFVDRYHKAIDKSAVDWDRAEFNNDFNRALDCCCIPRGTLNPDDYFADYVEAMHLESSRLIEAGISPHVQAE